MGSAPLDPNAFIDEHLGQVSDGTALMGHVHLKVGDLTEAEEFYADALGFAVTARSDGALFFAADGYHHHPATNIWQSAGAGERVNPTGLGSFEVTVPATMDLDAVAERLDSSGHDYTLSGESLSAADPWGHEVRVRVG